MHKGQKQPESFYDNMNKIIYKKTEDMAIDDAINILSIREDNKQYQAICGVVAKGRKMMEECGDQYAEKEKVKELIRNEILSIINNKI